MAIFRELSRLDGALCCPRGSRFCSVSPHALGGHDAVDGRVGDVSEAADDQTYDGLNGWRGQRLAEIGRGPRRREQTPRRAGAARAGGRRAKAAG